MDFLLAKIILNQVLILYIIFVTCYLSIYIYIYMYICLLYVKYTATKMSSNFSKPKQKLTET